MNTYDHIIFDELAQQRPVVLPEVGSLKVETIPAQIRDNRSLSAPRNVVVFTQEAPDNARNAVDILAESAGEQSAWDQYHEWLANSRKDGRLVIDGAGSLENGVFASSHLLDKLLNPNSQEAVAVKPHGRGWIWAIVSIIVLAALVLLGMRFCDDAKKAKTAEPAPVAKVAETRPAPVPETNAGAADTQAGKQGLGFPVEGRHYVVTGVFDIPSNADRQIEYLKRNFPDLTPEKFSYPGVRPGRTMVTAYSSTNRSEALDVRRQLAWNYDLHEYWLFPEDK